MSKQRQDKITGFGALVFGVLMLKLIIPRWVVTSDALNLTSPDTFPNFASWMLVMLGAALLIKTYVEEHAARREGQCAAVPASGECAVRPEPTASKRKLLGTPGFCVAATFLDIVLFGFLLDQIGYVGSSLICCTLLLAAYRAKKWTYYVTVAAFTLVLFYVFSVLLRVKMP